MWWCALLWSVGRSEMRNGFNPRVTFILNMSVFFFVDDHE